MRPVSNLRSPAGSSTARPPRAWTSPRRGPRCGLPSLRVCRTFSPSSGTVPRVKGGDGPDEEQQEQRVSGGGGAEERDADGEHEGDGKREDSRVVVPDYDGVDVGVDQLPVAGRVPPEQGHDQAGEAHVRKVDNLRKLVRTVPAKQR